MNLFLEVVEDLASFAYGSARNLLLPSAKIEDARRVITAPERYEVLGGPRENGGRALATRVSTLPQAIPSMSLKNLAKSTVMYTSSVATALRSAPGVVGDTVYTVLPYGSMVMVLSVEDMWAQVACGSFVGWVYIDDLEDRAAHVYPSFHSDEENAHDDPATLRLRAVIQDEFGAGEIGLPLQAEEYIMYRLIRRDVKVMWPPIRPRTPGTWHAILENIPGISITHEPKTGAVMEFTVLDETGSESFGHVAYVDAVFPDESIQISEINWPDNGKYHERVLMGEEWRALSPYFLIFS